MSSDTRDAPVVELVRRVQLGEWRPTDLVRESLGRIRALDAHINAFQLVSEEAALKAAEELEQRVDLSALPLAGLPIAVKDNLDVAGWPTRCGSLGTPGTPVLLHHEVVRRVIEAGAIVVGKTRMPELGIWATTDGAWGITRNPWDVRRIPGGSSGGSAAAVAAGMVPVAIGNDGLGSIRIPAACCGVFGFKPGCDVVPSNLGTSDWFNFTENGVLATTVEDGALLLSVLAAQPELARVREPGRALRIALSTRAPGVGLSINAEHKHATNRAAELLRAAGHVVEIADPAYSPRIALSILGHWCSAVAREVAMLNATGLEARTRAHARWGAPAEWLGLAGPEWRDIWRRRMQPLFDRFDVLLTPTLAQPPLMAHAWAQRSWLSNLISNMRYAPLCAPWNLAGYPAASVPFARHSVGTPIGVQLVALPGQESTLLGLARTLERLQPWARRAPHVM